MTRSGRSNTRVLIGLLATTLGAGCASIVGADFDRRATGPQMGADGGSTTSADSGPVALPVPAEGFVASYAHALCDDLARCCTENAYGFDADACLAVAQGRAQEDFVSPGKVAGLRYDPVAAGECVARTRQASQTCEPRFARNSLVNDPCQWIYTGGKKPGESCAESNDCAASEEGLVECVSWSVALPDGGSSKGEQCTLFRPATAGDSCDYAGPTHPSIVGACYEGLGALRCDPGTKTCQAARTLGASCTSGTCVEGAFCDTVNGADKCEPKRIAGQACREDTDCAAELYCDRVAQACAAKKAAGALCQAWWECTSMMCEGSKCRTNALARPELCGGGPTGG